MMVGNKEELVCRFIVTPTLGDVRQIIQLYRGQGWWQASDDCQKNLLQRLISGSHCFVVAEIDHMIVGMGRVISDGVSDAYIQDLMVAPAHRNKGIARMILQELLERLQTEGIAWIGLVAEPGSFGLYQKAGFKEMPGFLPMLMVRE